MPFCTKNDDHFPKTGSGQTYIGRGLKQERCVSLQGLREDFEIGFGCVSCEPGCIDSVETIVERVRALVTEGGVSPERVTLNPDCGFAPGMGAAVDPDEVYTKLKHQGEAGRILREEFSNYGSR